LTLDILTTATTMASTNNPTTTKTMAPLPPRTYSADGNSYTLRSLSEDGSEIDSWCDFCASVFADKKPVPPSAEYFARHYHNDPNRRASLIRVATVRRRDSVNKDDTEEIVASCRVFLRRVYVRRNDDDDDDDDDGSNHGSADCDQVDLGGIGEVCTSIRHRRKGLSRELLNDCVRMMQEQAQLKVSFLHSAPAYFPVYEGAGYCHTKTSWTVVPYNHGMHALSSASSLSPDGTLLPPPENPSGANVTVRRASFPEDADQLSRMYNELYSGVSGCLVRSRAYWDTYLGREWKDHMWVAATTAGSGESTGGGRHDEQLLGWMVARFRGSSSDTGTRRVQMCDGGISPSVSPEAATATEEATSAASVVFGALLHRAVDELCRADDVLPPAASTFDLVLPTMVASRLNLFGSDRWFDSSQSRIEIDEGWMYKALDDSAEDLAVVDRLRSGDHLVWPADSF
jgi:predicted GNAT family N-acyltransferase